MVLVRPINNMQMTHLRHISVFVDEPDPGYYHWVLHQSTEDASVWTELEASAESFPSWIAAFDAGNVALLQLVADQLIGPQAPGEDEDAAPVG